MSQSIPEERQTLLFSATLPKMLAQFARAGLRDPMLIRLDIDTKISEQLGLAFFTVRAGNKTAALLHLLREVGGRHRQRSPHPCRHGQQHPAHAETGGAQRLLLCGGCAGACRCCRRTS